MEASTITVHWHDENLPIYSVDFQPFVSRVDGDLKHGKSERLATAGGDNNIRLWKVQYDGSPLSIDYLCTLQKHTQAVNSVKFNKSGDTLASAGDDGSLILWKKSDSIVKEFGSEEDDEAKESWIAKNILRSSTSEIYDIAWSPDSNYIATGSMDNVIRVYDLKGQLYQLSDHSHYVQGIAWDPRGRYLATQSADRSVHVYEFPGHSDMADGKGDGKGEKEEEITSFDVTSKPKLVGKSSKATFSYNAKLTDPSMEGAQADEVAPKHKTSLLYHSETLQSFFRRLTFSPDGSLLLAPLGIFKQDEDSPVAGSPGTPGTIRASDFSGQLGSSVEETNTVYVYTRKGFGQAPVCHISGLKKPAIAISFSPVLYELTAKEKASPSPFKLPHKMIFAIATQDSIIIYDTAKMAPLGYASNLHYSTITDLVWDIDGRSLMVSSTDGFCSAIVFKESSFGKKIVDKVTVDAEKMEANEENKDKEEETRGDAKIESELQTKISSKTDELLEVRKISEGISEGINSAVDKIVANAITPVIPPPIAPIRLDPIMLASADSVSKFVAEPTNDISKFMAAPITPTTTNVASEPCTSIPTSDIESTHTETKDLATVVPAAKKRRIQPILIE